MPQTLGSPRFIEEALAAGIPQESLVGVLTARGWSEKEVYDALAYHYQRLTGIDVPRKSAAGASAKEAFFYLLIFSTLATWTIGFGCLAFSLIDRWLADPLFSRYRQAFDTYTITSSLAALIVAFPIYLLISRSVLIETHAPYPYHPKQGSEYELCATFARGSEHRQIASDLWMHPPATTAFQWTRRRNRNIQCSIPGISVVVARDSFKHRQIQAGFS